MLVKNPDMFVYLFNNIKNASTNSDKDVYVATGDLENTMLNTPTGSQASISHAKQAEIKDMIVFSGFKKISKDTSNIPFRSKP